jgi:intracellular sulfur oxidation DsrE/DsrF family protein
MKKYILIFAIFTLLTLCATLTQKTAETPTENYVVLTSNVKQLKPIFLAAKDLSTEDGVNFGEFKVIICGKTITDLAEKNNVKIVACGFSLKKFHINPQDIPKQIEIVPNGILYNFQLQKSGYLSITL